MAASNKPARSRRPDFCAIWTATAAVRLASLQLAGASQGERLQVRDDVFRGGTLPGRCRRSVEFVSLPVRKATKYWDQEQRRRIPACAPPQTHRQQGIIKAIQHELIECPVGIRRGQVGIQRDGLLGFGNRQLMLAGARQGETREQCVWADASRG